MPLITNSQLLPREEMLLYVAQCENQADLVTEESVPGTMDVHGAPIQILDLPGIIEGAKDGKGRGRQVIAGEFPCCSHSIEITGQKLIRDFSSDQSRERVIWSSSCWMC